MKDDYLILRDKDGKLITRAKRSRNRLYKVLIDIVDSKCLQTTITSSDSARWHACLGHVGMDSMSRMIKNSLVIGIPNVTVEKDTCSSCLLGKQARHSFPQATTYHANNILDLIHGDLCGPLNPSTDSKKNIFFLIDDHS